MKVTVAHSFRRTVFDPPAALRIVLSLHPHDLQRSGRKSIMVAPSLGLARRRLPANFPWHRTKIIHEPVASFQLSYSCVLYKALQHIRERAWLAGH